MRSCIALRNLSAAGVTVRLYQPRASLADAGLIVYLHGGAFYSGGIASHDIVCRELAAASGWLVANVEYRLAPEHPFPAGLTDCQSAIAWLTENAGSYGWDGKRIALVGDSSGGNFAAVLAADSVDHAGEPGYPAITELVLFYPELDLNLDAALYPSLAENGTGYGLETLGLQATNTHYFASGADPADPRVSPLERRDLEGLPATLVITAEFDPLRDQGIVYAERLREAGVDVSQRTWEGVNHGFVQNFGWIPEVHRVFEVTAEWLNSH